MPTKTLPLPGVYPFWFWNGDQSEDEIARQVGLFAQTGCRGVVLHARTGNKTPYLSDRWLALFRHACVCCRAHGLKVWIYDEEGYPSGNAGMRIQKMRPDLVQKRLVFAYETTSAANPALAAFDPDSLRRLDERSLPIGTPALRFHVSEYPRHVDTFAPDAIRLFIELTHERYAAALGDFFGGTVEGVYTDDESYLCCGADGFAWSPFLADAYRARFGEDIVDTLPLLVEERPGHEAARLRYHELAESLFLSNFVQSQQAWCDRHGLAYIGHLCGDEGPLSTSIKNYGLSQPYHRLQDIPSIDSYLCDLRDHSYLRNAYNSSATSYAVRDGDLRRFPCLLPFLHAGSVARIFKEHGLFSSEVLTFVSWEAPTSFIDTQILFELAMGVNLLTPHAFYYTVGDGTRRDCPPSYFYQQPYYPLLADLHRKWTRLAALLREGEPAGDTLVLSPNSVLSARRARDFHVPWVFGPPFEARCESADDRLDRLEHNVVETALDLLRRHVSFELLEESLFLGHACLQPDGGIRIGRRTFRTVVLPGALPWSDATRELLRRFAAAGGTVRGGCGSAHPTHAEIAPSVALDSSMDEVLARVRSDRVFLLNLSGRDLPFAFRRDAPFSLYDPGTDTVVFTGRDLPAGTMLRAGAACLIVQPSFKAARAPLENSVFAPVARWEALACDAVTPTRPNAFVIPAGGHCEIDIPEGCTVDSAYGEGLSPDTIQDNGSALDASPAPHHPCDIAFGGLRLRRPWRGSHELSMPKRTDPVYLEGRFLVREDGTLASPPESLALGNLVPQGLPHYWGTLLYRFRFAGRARLLRISLDNGMAEVFVNGRRCGVVAGAPFILPINDATRDGQNFLLVRFSNQCQNFVCAGESSPVPFGIKEASIAR